MHLTYKWGWGGGGGGGAAAAAAALARVCVWGGCVGEQQARACGPRDVELRLGGGIAAPRSWPYAEYPLGPS